MKSFLRLSVVFLLIIASSCKNKEKISETDNIFLFKDYITFNTYGNRSVTTDIRVGLTKPVEQFEITQELDAQEYLSISPKTKGNLVIENGNTLIFQPSEPLQADTEYSVTVKLNKLYEDIPKKFRSYTFAFRTITPNFKINVDRLQSYSKEWQYLEASVETSDIISAENAKKLVSASQNSKDLKLKWPENLADGKYFSFTIDSIRREKTPSTVEITWNGKSIGSKTKGTSSFDIPEQGLFKVLFIKTRMAPENSVQINFSESLMENQNFSGLIDLDGIQNLRFEAEGNVLTIYPQDPIVGEKEMIVFRGIRDSEGKTLASNYSELLHFDQLKPEIRLISKGNILPNSKSTPIYFEAVNLSKVDIRVIKIYEDNVLQFLQTNDFDDTDTYGIRRVGRRIAKRTVDLSENQVGDNGQWKAYAVDLSEYFEADPGAIYQLEFSFKKSYSTYNCAENIPDEDTEFEEYYSGIEDTDDSEEAREARYWDNEIYDWRNYSYNWEQRDNPCHKAYYNEERIVTTNILGSDLGLIAKKGNNRSYHLFATNLRTAEPEGNTKVTLYNYQQQSIGTLTANSEGVVVFDLDVNAAFAIAQKGKNYAYLKLGDGNSLSMSNFQIAGRELQEGLKGFIYTERGVYRPGDSIHLMFALNDIANPLPKEHPITLSVTDARGKQVQRNVLNKNAVHPNVENNFFYFPIATQASDPTGNWNATISVGGAEFNKTIRVATVKPNRLKLDLKFNDEILDVTKPVSGLASANWLTGPPARNMKIEMDATIRSSAKGFSNFPKYNFTDPVRQFDEVEIPVLKTNLSAEGQVNFSKKLEIEKKAPGMLTATFLTKVFEGGGDFSMDVFTKDLSPFSHFVGLKSPDTKEYGSYDTDSNIPFEVQSVDAKGRPAGNRKLKVQIFRIEWRWWWSRGEDNLSSYENSTVHRTYNQFDLTTDGNGKGNFNVNIPDEDGGRYLIRVIDENSGHATGTVTYFYQNWWRSATDMDAESAKMLVFTPEKETYQVGEKAQISFPSGSEGRALISIENGTEVLQTQWIKTEKGETKTSFEITEIMAPTIYVNISLLQPHEQTKNNHPIRLYGVIPLTVENPKTILHPKIEMPETLRPEEKFTIQVSEENKKPMTYTIAVVDEGLLDLTRFKTPDIHDAFYTREALGVKTFDMFDYVIGAYSQNVENIYTVGGGDEAAGAKNRKADRFKPVVKFLGPFTLKAGKKTSHQITMPNYVGSVRTMVVAGDNEKSAYGNAEKTSVVKKPLMVFASLPRKLSPGETVTLPVTVFAMENKIKQVQVSVKTGDKLRPLNGSSKTISFSEPGEQIVNFDFEVLPAQQFQTIEVSVNGNGEKATYEVEIDVENPNPISRRNTDLVLEGNASQTLNFETFGIPGTNEAIIEFSTLPPMDFSKRMEFLIHYPYGCLEQVTSTGFPQLFLADIFDLSSEKKYKIEKNIKATIHRLGNYQLPNGGLTYWPGEREADNWSTSYAGHFMLEAKQKGFALPISFMNNWIAYQQQAARQWRNSGTSHNSTLDQAYRLYTLALAGNPELAAMNRLRENQNLSNDAKWRLAAAYALSGKKDVAKQIIQTANIDFTPKNYDYYTYGSPFRNKAMALETMVLLEDNKQRDLAVSIAKDLSSNQWFSTQETSYALLAMAKMVEKNKGKDLELTFTSNGKNETIKTGKTIAQRELDVLMGENSISLSNQKDNVVYVTLTQNGKLPLGDELTEQRNLSLKTQFFDGEGKPMDVSKLKQGTEILAKVSISNTSNNDLNNMALTQIFPSGWEIVNTSFTELGGGAEGDARYIDIRDDRVDFFFSLDKRKTKTFTVKLNASYLGRYYLPGAQAEEMYDNSYYARTQGKWVEIEP